MSTQENGWKWQNASSSKGSAKIVSPTIASPSRKSKSLTLAGPSDQSTSPFDERVTGSLIPMRSGSNIAGQSLRGSLTDLQNLPSEIQQARQSGSTQDAQRKATSSAEQGSQLAALPSTTEQGNQTVSLPPSATDKSSQSTSSLAAGILQVHSDCLTQSCDELRWKVLQEAKDDEVGTVETLGDVKILSEHPFISGGLSNAFSSGLVSPLEQAFNYTSPQLSKLLEQIRSTASSTDTSSSSNESPSTLHQQLQHFRPQLMCKAAFLPSWAKKVDTGPYPQESVECQLTTSSITRWFEPVITSCAGPLLVSAACVFPNAPRVMGSFGNAYCEDSYFLSPCALGVADGVGGSRGRGDPARFSQLLMAGCYDAAVIDTK